MTSHSLIVHQRILPSWRAGRRCRRRIQEIRHRERRHAEGRYRSWSIRLSHKDVIRLHRVDSGQTHIVYHARCNGYADSDTSYRQPGMNLLH